MLTKDIIDDRVDVGVREVSRREASRSCNVPQERESSTQQNRQLADQIRINLGYFCRSGCTAIADKPEIRPKQILQSPRYSLDLVTTREVNAALKTLALIELTTP
jgi:hypothetical protein